MNDYDIPRGLERLAYSFRFITWREAIELYRHSVDEVLFKYNVNTLQDIPYGKGYVEVGKLFDEKITRINSYREKNKIIHEL